jgi:hypothetical protein
MTRSPGRTPVVLSFSKRMAAVEAGSRVRAYASAQRPGRVHHMGLFDEVFGEIAEEVVEGVVGDVAGDVVGDVAGDVAEDAVEGFFE